MVALRPIRSEASRMCGTAKRALNLPSGGAEEVYRGRPPVPDGHDGEVAVHLVLPDRVSLQHGPALLDFPGSRLP
jgi:hypothetical protein